jgi:DNA-binding beta-propeller fold protein YncE
MVKNKHNSLMKTYHRNTALFYISLLSCIIFSACNESPANKTPDAVQKKDSTIGANKSLSLTTSIKLPAIKGGFDLMAIDAASQRLFLAAEDNHSVEVIDIKNKQLITSLPSFNEPKWIVYRPESNRLYVATGGDGKVTVLDATTYKFIKSFSFKEKCNNLRFDSTAQQLYVGVGKTFGSIVIIDVKNDKIINEIPLADFPKQFELDGNKIYVNLPSKNSIAVIDRVTKKVITNWPVIESTENVPMALDKLHHRLFVACDPGKFIVYNTETGKSVANLTISKNADGIYLDVKRSLIYISCGEGFIEVIQQKDANTYFSIEKIKTLKGAGTSLFSPAFNQLYLAVPQTETSPAELRVYKTAN